MTGFRLIVHGAEPEKSRFKLSSKQMVIGRAPNVDILLSGHSVSRHHAKIWVENDSVVLEDMHSLNGVYVHGKPVMRTNLHPGDQFVVGRTIIEVASVDTNTTGVSISFDASATLYQKMMDKDANRFPILYKTVQLLGSVLDIDDLMKQILEVIFEAVPARRGFVLTVPQNGKDAVVRAMLSSDGEGEGPPLSRAVVDRVMNARESVLTHDAQDDIRFDSTESIKGHSIRAAMCVPLCGRQSIEGAIYVDSGRSTQSFTKNNLQLLTVIGHIVGIAVENARIIRENLERERLAALGQAMGEVGHCMKNILTGIRGGGEFIDHAIEKKDLNYLERGWPLMRRAIDRFDMLVMNMLTFTRDRPSRRAPVDINALAKQVLSDVEARATRLKNVTIEFAPGSFQEEAIVDAQGVQRILQNLVANAIDACERNKGTVTVATACDADAYRIVVRDTGEGIPPDTLKRLGEPFVSTKGSSGIGLGLACSYKLAREQGGDILVESEVGKGSKFTVVLPRQKLEIKN